MEPIEDHVRHRLIAMRDKVDGPRLAVIACPRRTGKTWAVAKLQPLAEEIGVALLDDPSDEDIERAARESTDRVLVLVTPRGPDF